MCMLDKRLQILLDTEQYRRIAAVAQSRGVSVARVIREAIDAYVPTSDAKRAAAAKRILEAEPMPVPATVEEFRAELDEIRSGGL